MNLTEFLQLVDECNQILSEADEVAWQPNQVANFKNTRGISRDHATDRLDRRIDVDHDQYNHMQANTEKPSMAEPKQGDIVIIQDPTGNQIPGVIVSIANGNAQVVNNKRNLNVTRAVSNFGLAPVQIAQHLQKGSAGAGRSVWMHTSST